MDHSIQVIITANIDKALAGCNTLKGKLDKIKGTKVDADFSGVSRGAKSAEGNVDALGSAISKLKGIVAGAFAVGSIYSFGKAALTAAANTELLHKGLSFVLNSDEEASRLVKNIQEIGEASAYDTTQLLPLARAWVNIGDNVDTATSKIQKVVDLGSAYGLTADQVGAVNLALTQMQMAGKIGQQDMMQLINAGIPAWTILSEKMGIPVEQLKDMSSKSLLTEDAMNQLWDGITEKTEGAASTMSDTLMGKFSNAEEAVQNSMGAIGEIMSQAFDIPGLLDEVGEFTESFKQHITAIRDSAKEVGLHEAIVDELNKISPAAANAADAVMNAFSSIKDTVEENKTAVGILVEAIVAIGATVAVIKTVETAFYAVKGAVTAFTLACEANPVVLAISLIVAALVVLYTHWDEITQIVESVESTVSSVCSNCEAAIEQKFSSAINTVKGWWQDFVNFLSHPITATVNIIKSIREYNASQRPNGAYKGGVFGMATGGVVGGLVPLANGGQLNHGTPAIVGEAGPEAVIPLRDNVLATIGKAVAAAYSKGKNGKGNAAAEIVAKIKSVADTKPVTEYAKILADAQKKAESVGDEIAKYTSLQEQANEKVKQYNEGGEKAVEYQSRLAQLNEQIAKAGEGTDKYNSLTSKRDTLTSNFEKEKADAVKNAQDIAAQKQAIEQSSADAIANIQMAAEEKVYSRKAQLQQAQHQLDLASQAESQAAFLAKMNERDEVTGESYATTLANEQALSDMRQIWHDQMMTNAVDWGTYMDELFTKAEDSLTNGVAQGLAQCIVYGKNFSDIMSNLVGNVLSTLLQGVLKKALTSVETLLGLSRSKSKEEIAQAKAEQAAQAAKSGVMAANATAAVISAMPFMAWEASPLVIGAMQASRTAVAGTMFAAEGGYITGPGTGTSDSIPAMLSNGEYVINAAAVRRLGTGYLNTLNSPHYADGGQVGTGAAGSVGNTVTMNVSALDAGTFMDFLRNGGMDTIKQMLFDGTRNFTTDSGVW